jgi:hypothetical protein
MILQHKFKHCLASLPNSFALGGYRHAIGDRRGTRRLELWHFLNFYQTHPTGTLERQAGIVAKGRNLNAGTLTGFNQQCSWRCGDRLAVNRDRYVAHST